MEYVIPIPFLLIQIIAMLLVYRNRLHAMLKFRIPYFVLLICMMTTIVGTAIFLFILTDSVEDSLYFKLLFFNFFPGFISALVSFRLLTYYCAFTKQSIDFVTGNSTSLSRVITDFKFVHVVGISFIVGLVSVLFGLIGSDIPPFKSFNCYSPPFGILAIFDFVLLIQMRRFREGYRLFQEHLILLILKIGTFVYMIFSLKYAVLGFCVSLPTILLFYPLILVNQEKDNLSVHSGKRQYFEKQVLTDEELLKRISRISKKRFCSELVRFVKDYNNEVGIDKIFYTYIQKQSPLELNLDSQMQEHLILLYEKQRLTHLDLAKPYKFAVDMLFDNIGLLYFNDSIV